MQLHILLAVFWLIQKVTFSTEKLVVRILRPSPHNLFIRQAIGVPQVSQTDQQAYWYSGTSLFFRIQSAELLIKSIPRNEFCQTIELMAMVENVFKSAPKQITLRVCVSCGIRPRSLLELFFKELSRIRFRAVV